MHHDRAVSMRWQALAAAQEGMLARRQLRTLDVDSDAVRNRIAAGKWAARSRTVISTFTGPLDSQQRLWLGVLHAGDDALVGGLTAAAVHGLRRWEREDVTVLIPEDLKLEPLAGNAFVRTRRPLLAMRDRTRDLPVCRIEPAVLLYAAYTHSVRSAHGLLAATVQQRLTTPHRLRGWIDRMSPLRRAARFRETLCDIEGGAQSLSEVDMASLCREHGLPAPIRQTRRRDSSGRVRFTDCEWRLPGGMVLVLEIDGAFHMETEHWEDDIARQRGLATPNRIVVRCTGRELRDEPRLVLRDLERLGVRSAA